MPLTHILFKKPVPFIFITALCMRFLFLWYLWQSPLKDMDRVFHSSDMYGNLEWALHILQGDYLQIHTWHPFHPWMSDIGNRKEWETFWQNKHIFQQSPLYAYLLALWIALFHGNILFIKCLQVMIGALSCVLTFLVARRFLTHRFACIAGLLSALYFPSLCFESFFLREFLAVHLLLWLLYFLPLSTQENKHVKLLGFICALSVATRENFILLPAILLPYLYLKTGKTQVIFFCLSFALTLSPLFLRNFIAGAPVLSTSNRLLEALIEGLAFDATHVFMSIPDSFASIFATSQGNLWIALKGIFNTYPSVSDMGLVLLKKLFFLVFFLEPHNNLNLYYFWRDIPVFQLLPNYGGLFIFCIPGFYFFTQRSKTRIILVIFVLLLLSLLFSPILARYRYVLLPFYVILCAKGLQYTFIQCQRYLSKKNTAILIAITIVTLSVLSIHCVKREWTERHAESQILLMKRLPDNL